MSPASRDSPVPGIRAIARSRMLLEFVRRSLFVARRERERTDLIRIRVSLSLKILIVLVRFSVTDLRDRSDTRVTSRRLTEIAILIVFRSV